MDEDPGAIELLPGTVKYYERHLYVCTGRTSWAAEISADDAYLTALAAALERSQASLARRVKLGACNAPSEDPPAATPAYDLLVFPDNVRYVGITEADFPALIDDHLIGDRPSPRLRSRPVDGWHLFVCVHGRRDARCGTWGPLVARRLERELAGRGLTDSARVYRSSHVGGHRFAGNLLVYPGGDWYGLVRPDDVPELIEGHIVAGRVVRRLWRGRMGLTPQEQLALAATMPGHEVR